MTTQEVLSQTLEEFTRRVAENDMGDWTLADFLEMVETDQQYEQPVQDERVIVLHLPPRPAVRQGVVLRLMKGGET